MFSGGVKYNFTLSAVLGRTMEMCVRRALPNINSAGERPVVVCGTLRYAR